ncbi:MAG: phosphoadenosine phosphosulfate reductase family protein [Desulfobacterales bacterium]|nr:phosphoadenosine phosphosulfate reductase family protein [Desulfobacterales bacterium]
MDRFHDYGLYSDIAEFRGGKIVNTLEWKSFWLIKQEIKNQRVSMALSFGKDSMTMLHICHKYDLLKDIDLVMWNNSGMEYPDALEFRDYVLSRYDIPNYQETCPEDPFSYFRGVDILDKEKRNDFVFDCLEKPRWEMMDQYDINCTLLGLRNEEARGRRINYCIRGNSYWNEREKAKIITPISLWKATDVFTYAAYENIPIHPHYGICERAGLPREEARVNFISDTDGFNTGRIAKLMTVYPEYFALLASKGFDINRLI